MRWLFVLSCICSLMVVSASLFFILSLWQVHTLLQTISNRIQEDITFENNSWDTSAYNADPLLPGTAPVYVLATDGFVLERWKPIAGFLDAADFKHLLTFQEPTTLQTELHQRWRIFSLPIKNQAESIGVITVSTLASHESLNTNDDTELKQVTQLIREQVQIQNGTAVVGELNDRHIPHYISYQVVNSANRIIVKSNNNTSVDRLPNFIDPSYVSRQLESIPYQLIKDQKNQDYYLLRTQALRNDLQQTVGVIVVGENLTPLLTLIIEFLLISLSGLMLIAGFFFSTQKIKVYWSHHQLKSNELSFDSHASHIVFNSQVIPITFAIKHN